MFFYRMLIESGQSLSEITVSERFVVYVVVDHSTPFGKAFADSRKMIALSSFSTGVCDILYTKKGGEDYESFSKGVAECINGYNSESGFFRNMLVVVDTQNCEYVTVSVSDPSNVDRCEQLLFDVVNCIKCYGSVSSVGRVALSESVNSIIQDKRFVDALKRLLQLFKGKMFPIGKILG